MAPEDQPRRITAGLNTPNPVTPARRPSSVRRTSHLDMWTPADTAGTGVPGARRITGTCRDVRTDATGAVDATEEARLDAVVTWDRLLLRLATEPPLPAHAFGEARVPVAQGFRAELSRVLPDDEAAGTPRFVLLDDLPVAALIAGYADLYADHPRLRDPNRQSAALKADICAGWRTDGTMIPAYRATGRIPIPLGPPAPPAAADATGAQDDPWAWHALPPLPPSAMRRRRLLDVAAAPGTDGARLAVLAWFRDTHTDEAGTETVLHEYSLTATIEATTGLVLACAATPHVLPWDECPAAAASAGQLVGRSLATVRTTVAKELRGIGVCTHLNDLLRSLAYVPVLDRARRAPRDGSAR